MRLDSIRHVSTNIGQEAAVPAQKAKKRENRPSDTANKQRIEDDVVVTHGGKNELHKTYGQYDRRPDVHQKPEDELLSASVKDESDSDTMEAETPSETELGVSTQSGAPGGVGAKTAPPTDNSGELTKRLVAAQDTITVQMILTEAFKGMGSLRMTVAMGSDDDAKAARAIIRKLEKVANRSRRKIRDLGDEEQLLRNQMKAEREEKTQQAKEIKAELRKREMERKRREQGYLRDAKEEAVANSGNKTDSPAAPKLDAATEARIAAQAEAMAQAEVASASAVVTVETGITDSGGQGSSVAGTGAEGSVTVSADAASVDIAV